MKYINCHTHHPLVHQDNKHIQIINLDINNPIFSDENYYSIGVHPWLTKTINFSDAQDLIHNTIKDKKVVAIGECGLDSLRGGDLEKQSEIFSLQISIAIDNKLPIIIHCVRAYQEVIKILKTHKVYVPVIFHGFNKSLNLAKQILDEGYYISLGDDIVKHDKNEMVRSIPLDRLFLETDDKDISIEIIYEAVSRILNIELEKLSLQILENFNKVFNLNIEYNNG